MDGIVDRFSRYADDYDRWFDDHPEAYRQELALVAAGIGTFRRGVEIGVGTGRFAAPLGLCCGIEPAAGMARLARERGLTVIPGSAEDLPLCDGAFDLALMGTVICYLPNPAQALAEAHRILAPGGRLVLAFIERDGAIARKYLRDGEKSRFLSHARFFSRGEVAALIAGAGFLSVRFAALRNGFAVTVCTR